MTYIEQHIDHSIITQPQTKDEALVLIRQIIQTTTDCEIKNEAYMYLAKVQAVADNCSKQDLYKALGNEFTVFCLQAQPIFRVAPIHMPRLYNK